MNSLSSGLGKQQSVKSVTNQPTSSSLPNADLAASLCVFLKDCLASFSSTSPYATACYFQLFRILHDVVNAIPALVDDKRYVKDIQDVTHKLFELCNSIVASSLQQTTWLRKNYAVRLAAPSTSSNTLSNSTSSNLAQSASSTANVSSSSSTNASTSNSAAQNTTSASSNSNSAAQTGMMTAVGAGPAVGGTILIHSDSNNSQPISALSASQQTVSFIFNFRLTFI